MSNQVGPVVTLSSEERNLWTIRYWSADIVLSSGAALRSDGVVSLVTEQEASLIDSLRKRDRYEGHMIYADWLEERELGTAAIAHRLAAEGFEWRKVSSQICFLRGHIFGMYDGYPSFHDPSPPDLMKTFGMWIVPLGDIIGPKIPHAEYIGHFDLQTVIGKIYQVSWQLRDFSPNEKESST